MTCAVSSLELFKKMLVLRNRRYVDMGFLEPCVKYYSKANLETFYFILNFEKFSVAILNESLIIFLRR